MATGMGRGCCFCYMMMRVLEKARIVVFKRVVRGRWGLSRFLYKEGMTAKAREEQFI